MEDINTHDTSSDETTFDDWITEQFTTINDTLSLYKMQLTTLQKVVKTVEKTMRKKIKTIKRDAKTDKPKLKRFPSGFAKPTTVSNELCEFMDKPTGTEIARTEATKALVTYIKTNNLFEIGEDTKHKIVPDEKLRVLLQITQEDTDNLTYFTIQKHMNRHFNVKPLLNTDMP
jgi:chromatin remodeling complex protein RSC6